MNNNLTTILNIINEIENRRKQFIIQKDDIIAPGIENLGVTCFHNAATQLFYRIVELRDFLSNDKIYNQYPLTFKVGSQNLDNPFRKWLEILRIMKNTTESYIKKEKILTIVPTACNVIFSGSSIQQDSQEFLSKMIDFMTCTKATEGINDRGRRKINCDANISEKKLGYNDPRTFLNIISEDHLCDIGIIIDKSEFLSKLKDISKGYQNAKDKHDIRWEKEEFDDNKFEQYIKTNIKTLDIQSKKCTNYILRDDPKITQILKIELDNNTTKSISELIEDMRFPQTDAYSQSEIKNKNKYKIVVKRFNYKPNKYLIIHLNIFETIIIPGASPIYNKKDHHIKLADENGEFVFKYLDNKIEKQKTYELIGMVNQFGSLTGGHYTAHIKYNNVWYEYNDRERTKKNDITQAYSSAYLVLYREKNIDPIETIDINNVLDKLEEY